MQYALWSETLERRLNPAPCVLQTYFRIRLAYKKSLKNKNKKFPPQFFFLYLFSMQLSSADATMFSIFFFAHKKLKKSPQKVAYLVHLGVFKSLQPQLPKPAQNFISVL